MVKYIHPVTDSVGCTHSIDNVVIDYIVDSFSRNSVLSDLGKIFKSADPLWTPDKCSKVDLPACSKYQFFKSTIWCKGFHCSYGQYRDFDPVDRSYTEYPVLRVKFNPNKYADSAVFDPLFSWINSRCVDGTLVKFDYAVDVPCRLEDLVVQSRKEPGLFKGTRYYGQRNQHGRVKIYDKGKESAFRDDSDLDVSDDPITRIEYTFCAGRPLSFDVILWLTRGPEPLPDVSVLGSQSYALARLLRDLRACGGDVSLGLSYLDARTRKN